jgi:DNA-binding CsgD family transcriptional regulator
MFNPIDFLTTAAASLQGPSGAMLRALFDQVGSGLIVCDAEGRIQLANRAAQAELRSARLLHDAGGLLQRAASTEGELSQALRLAATRGRRSLVRLQAGTDRLHVSTLPLAGDSGALVLVVLGRRRACSELELELLAGSYGLTQAERRVLGGLMQEERPSEIAERHAVKLSTVRTQISSIRAKLGTRSVEGLLLRAAEVPAMPPVLGLAA